MPPLRLGVNIDHVATIRNARGGQYPDPVRAAKLPSPPAPTASPRICARTAATPATTTLRG
jgi:pyridoxine 5'-phosphate synthase PdxJ